MNPAKTIAFLYPGSMGASLAHLLSQVKPELTLLTSLSSRSQATIDRASASGLTNVPLEELTSRSDIILSILPPSSALTLAREITAILPSSSRRVPPIYIDANAIAPTTVTELAGILKPHAVPFIDGSILGGPAKDGYCPRLYLSADQKWENELKLVESVLGGWKDNRNGIDVKVMHGAGEGAASALKMCYGGINKGYTGIATLMVLGKSLFSPVHGHEGKS
jgi:hypothetical protein